ncbi:hypothetical protein CK203_108839 [Vitis vinifera]|uniref:Reverse transcriptase Ty1/copia-type domain-containing protein n=1 Tax=Vitis vinifera TaxID=29760 RepID=A0A438CG64_VITVI|nr:hypothetical protein CK203_108839 [Vitis vinifera]
MVVKESIHVIFDESNNFLQERESVDDGLGLETCIGRLQIEDRRQQEENGEDPKKEESPLALPFPQQVQGESSQDLSKEWKFVINHPQDQIIGELNFFLGLQIKQPKEGTFINQVKYIRDLLKRFNMEEAKTMKTPMSSSIKLDKDEKGGESKNEKVCKNWKVKIVDYIDQAVDRSLGGRSVLNRSTGSSGLRPLRISRASFSTSFPLVLQGLRRFSGHREIFSVIASACQSLSISAHLGFQGKRPAELSQLEAPRKALFDTALFSYVEDYQLYKQHFAQRRVVLGININFSQLQHFKFKAFYSRATYDMCGPIISIVRGIEIRLDPKSIYRIFDIAMVGLRVYESKMWPTMPGFEPREAIKRICGLLDAYKMGKPSAYILMIHLGYLMMMHMIACCESTTRVLSYDCFLIRVFKDVGVNLSRETDFEAPSTYDTYDDQSMERMKFEKALKGSWASVMWFKVS